MTKSYARRIKTRRDYKSAAAAADLIRQQPERESAEEQRLQALIREMDRFDDQIDDEDDGDASADLEGLPQRRWSDDAADAE